MEWIDANHVKGEMGDAEFGAKVAKEEKTRDMKKYGRDGMFTVYHERFTYRNVPYEIGILRYYQIGIPLDQIKGMNHIGKWAVLEYTDETKPIHELMEKLPHPIGSSEWMYADTLHIWNRDMTLKEMVEAMHEEARRDIDKLDEMKELATTFTNEVIATIEKMTAIMAKCEEPSGG